MNWNKRSRSFIQEATHFLKRVCGGGVSRCTICGCVLRREVVVEQRTWRGKRERERGWRRRKCDDDEKERDRGKQTQNCKTASDFRNVLSICPLLPSHHSYLPQHHILRASPPAHPFLTSPHVCIFFFIVTHDEPSPQQGDTF